MKRIYIIDGNSLMFRGYFATAYTGNLMKNKNGLYTNAIYAFCSMMMKLLQEDMTHIFVAFDAGSQTFRHQQLESYKGTRKQIPEELLMQIPYIKQFLDVLKIKHMASLEYEADDFIATVSRHAKKEGIDEIRVISGDKDLLQLVSPKINVYLTKKGLTELDEYNTDNFYDKMGIHPNQIPDYKGLVGDTSDNLPGIKGIGDKTAVKLLKEFKTLENLIENAGLVKGNAGKLIANDAKIGMECKRLATLIDDIELDFNIGDTLLEEPNHEGLVSYYKEMGFNSFLEKIDGSANEEENLEVKIINGEFDFSAIKEVTISVEVFGNNYYHGKLLGIGLLSNNQALFVTEKGLNNQSLIYLLNDEKRIKDIFDYKKAYVVLKNNGFELRGVNYDALLAAYIINPANANEDLKKVADEYISNTTNYDHIIYGSGAKAKIPNQDLYASHAISKCRAINKLKPILLKHLQDNDQMQLFSIEISLSPILGDMEISGLKVDRSKLEAVGKDLLTKKEEIAQQIYLLAGEKFNINSVKQLGEILFNKLGLPTGKKGKTGYSTASNVLEKLVNKYPIAQLILDYRGVAKIINTYINGMFEVMSEDNYVNPLYKQALTVTGRLSSTEPNIQNMPIRTELGQVIREAFISRFNGDILSSDYSQIELRVLAHLSNDEKMIDMFNHDIDFHKQTAMLLYDVDVNQVTSGMRRTAKAINFGIIYGMSAWGLSEAIEINPIDAGIYIEKYFNTFKGVKAYLDNTIEEAKAKGFTKTIFNRRRYINELSSSNNALYKFGERTAMNSPIQGSAADIIKLAMIEIKKKMQGMKSIMIAQVHDELLFDVYPGELAGLEEIVRKSMESVIKLKVPLIVGISHGKNWLKA